jgi:PTH1 family peptidyl-tRNA hydrolase
MKLIVGLGNPGEKYIGVRHNLGFEILDEVAKKFNLEDWSREEKFKSELIKTPELILAKPQTYMNNSGMAVKLLANYYKIAPEDIIIIHDELDLPLGKIKVRKGGAAAGHHGVESIIALLGTEQFIRVRLGIGPVVGIVEKFVLELFTSKEKPPVKHMIKQAIKAIDLLLEKGLAKAQNQYN